MPPLGLAHWTRHGIIVAYLMDTVRPFAQVQGRIAIPLGDRSEPEPEPDIAILADVNDQKRNRGPKPSEIYAMIEIAGETFRLTALPDVELAGDAFLEEL